MPGVYSELHAQIVFATKYREALLDPSWEERIYKYICKTTENKNQKILSINGHWDHVHLLLGFRPTICISDLVRDIKRSSSLFINELQLTKSRFAWQDGFGAFSYSKKDIDAVAKYILNQKEHHRKITFKEEYIQFLENLNIEFDERYLFDFTLLG